MKASADWSLDKCVEIHLAEFDADIFHWDKKIGETKEIEMCSRVMIPENTIRPKGKPTYFIARKQEDINRLREKLIEEIKKLKVFDEDERYNEDVIRIINRLFGEGNK